MSEQLRVSLVYTVTMKTAREGEEETREEKPEGPQTERVLKQEVKAEKKKDQKTKKWKYKNAWSFHRGKTLLCQVCLRQRKPNPCFLIS